MNPPVVGAQHLEMEAAQVHDLAALRKPTQFHHHQSAHRVGSLVAQFGLEVLVEVCNWSERLNNKGIALRTNEHAVVIFGIVFIVYFADDLLQYVFNGDQPGHPAVFIHHYRHV